jgi:hypothetical protein
MRLLAILLTFSCVGCSESSLRLPIPVLDKSITLSVMVVSNPALPPIPRERVDRILAEAAREAEATFGTKIEFPAPVHVSIDKFFQRFDAAFAKRSKDLIYDFKRETGDQERLAKALEKTFRESGSSYDALYRFARAHLVAEPKLPDFRELGIAVAQTHIARLRRLRDHVAEDGRRVISDEPYNEYVYWEAAGRYSHGFEVVITNQLLASAEYLNPDLHSSLRGGITNGITSECVDCPYGTFSVVSTYPLWSKDATIQELRDVQLLEESEAIRAAALVLVHELGHQLFHYGHPFGQSGCVMSPIHLLRFREWSRGIDAKGCAFGSQPMLVPGFYKFYDLRKAQ